MKDADLRGIILQQFYDRRSEGWLSIASLRGLAIPQGVERVDAGRVCSHLGEHGMITWQGIPDFMGKERGGSGMITALGVDVMERQIPSPIAIHFNDSRHGQHVHGSAGPLDQTLMSHFENLIHAIDAAQVPNADKKEAKAILAELLITKVADAIFGAEAAALLKILGF